MPWQLSSQIPINPIHAAVGRTGKVLFFAGSGNVETQVAYNNSPEGVRLWDPNNPTVFTTPTIPRDSNGNPIDLFCAGHSFRADGQLFVAGGTLRYDPFYGIPDSFVFNFTGNNGNGTWTKVASMYRGRWYPTVLTLGDGRIFSLSGLDISGGLDRNPEIFNGSSGWKIFTQPTSYLALYAHLILLSSGKLFYTGAQLGGNNGVSPRILTLPSKFNRAIAEQSVSGLQNASYGNQAASVLLPPAQDQKVMIIGGGDGGTATNRVNVVNLSNSTNYTAVASLNYARMHHNAVLLPDRTVFVCNGSGGEENISLSTLPAEIYNPATNTWTAVETPIVNGRVYHSVAVLLPDGRVVAAGGNPQRGTYENRIEIYSPAYMSQTRPVISSAPAATNYSRTITIQTNQPATNIKWVHLIRPMATTHGLDTEQRVVDLPISSRSGNSLSVQITGNRNIAPPGYYMLFVVDNNNVPSVASWIQLT
ncbi:kelch repeat-containing protein [Kalymmatonema gypsitolerans NIES-4073]|nr:kelch repeat-containing protein [Scytonema sp. NIES-4073]